MKATNFTVILVLFLFINADAAAQDQGHFYPISLAQRIKNATVIAEGKVISSQGFWDEAHRNIYTSNIVQVTCYLKGNCNSDQLEIVTPGGVVGLEMEVQSSALQLGVGQKGIFFAEPHQIKGSGLRMPAFQSFDIYSGAQGFIEYDLAGDKAADLFTKYPTIETVVSDVTSITKKEIKLDAYNSIMQLQKPAETLATPTISGFSPATISAGTSSILTINGTGFNAVRGSGYVEFKNSNNGGSGWMQPLPSDYISWTDTQIQLYVPSTNTSGGTAGTGQVRVTNSDPATATSAGNLTINYAYINVPYALDGTNYYAYRPDHVNANGTGGYTIQYNTVLAANAPAVAAFGRAMSNWTCATGMNWQVGATTAATGGASDGINTISFSGSLSAGTLATTYSRYSGCLSGGNLVWYVTEIDMEYNNTYTWNYSVSNAPAGQIDFESVAVHELGHAHQLTHVINSTRVMHYAIGAGVTMRTLTTDDITGGNQVMANSLVANICGNTSPMTVLTCSQTLPVRLEYFTGTKTTSAHLLTWSSIREIELKEYQLQHSFEGGEYAVIATVTANGNSNLIQKYSATNDQPLPGRHTYRLKMINNDGSFEYSDVVMIKEDAIKVYITGNPFKRYFFVSLPSRSGRAQIRVTDASGKIVLNHSVSPGGSDRVRIEFEKELVPGMYFVEVFTDGKQYVQKLLRE